MKHPYSKRSQALLNLVDPKLKRVFEIAADVMDITILDSTIRTYAEQAEFVRTGKSTTMRSKHLIGDAVDAAPAPINFDIDAEFFDMIELAYKSELVESSNENMNCAEEILENIKKWFYLKGVLDGIAKALNIDIRQGHDWDGDEDYTDSSFVDLPHTELRD